MDGNTTFVEESALNRSVDYQTSSSLKIIKTNNLRNLRKSPTKSQKENELTEKGKNKDSHTQRVDESKERNKQETNLKEENLKKDENIEDEDEATNHFNRSFELSRSPKINCFGRISILKRVKLNVDLNEVKKNMRDYISRNSKTYSKSIGDLTDTPEKTEKENSNNHAKTENPDSVKHEKTENENSDTHGKTQDENSEKDVKTNNQNSENIEDKEQNPEKQEKTKNQNSEDIEDKEQNPDKDETNKDADYSIVASGNQTNACNEDVQKIEEVKLICETEIAETDKNLSFAATKPTHESKDLQEKKEDFILVRKNSIKALENKSIRAGFSFYRENSNKIKQSSTKNATLKAKVTRRSLRDSFSILNDTIKVLSTSTFADNNLNQDSCFTNSDDALNNSDFDVYDRALKSLENIDSNLNVINLTPEKKEQNSLPKEESKSAPPAECTENMSETEQNKKEEFAIVENKTNEENKGSEKGLEESKEEVIENVNKTENDYFDLLECEPQIISKNIDFNSYNMHRKSKSINFTTTNPLNILSSEKENAQNDISINDSFDDADKEVHDDSDKRVLNKQLSLNNYCTLKDQEYIDAKKIGIKFEDKLNINKTLYFFDLFLNVYRKINHRISCHYMCNQFILNFFKLSNIEELMDQVQDENERKILNDFLVILELFLIIAYDFSHEGLIFDIHITYLIDIVKQISKVFLKFLNFIILKNQNLNQPEPIKFFEDSVNKNLKKQIVFGFNQVPQSILNSIKISNFEINEAIKKIVIKHPNNFLRNFLNQYFSNQITIDTKYLNEFYLKNVCFEFEYGNKQYLGLIDSKSESANLDDLKLKIPCFRIRLNIKTPYKGAMDKKHAEVTKDLAKKASEKRFALVLDLDETLIHFDFSNKNYFNNNDFYFTDGVLHVRPGLTEFLESMQEYYELIIFTLGTQGYADPILDTIENGRKFFSQRLYRSNATIFNMDFAKDLSNLGWDLSKIALVDNLESNFAMQRDNGILIKSFHGNDSEDKSLFELRDILKEIALSEENDLRVAIKNKLDIIKKNVS